MFLPPPWLASHLFAKPSPTSSHLSLSDFKAAPERERERALIRNTSECAVPGDRDQACKADMVMRVSNDAYNSI